MGLERIKRRYQELADEADRIDAAKTPYHSSYASGDWQPDGEAVTTWIVNVEHLLELSAGAGATHVRAFVEGQKFKAYEGAYPRFRRLRAILLAAKADFDGGHMTSMSAIIHAEVFDSELDQARALLKSGYKTPAAVIAGVVIETAIRQLCANRGIAAGKLDKMNADLCKAGLYTLLVQKRVTALADIRNNAAHGHPDKFNDDDVDDMIRQVERFLADYPA